MKQGRTLPRSIACLAFVLCTLLVGPGSAVAQDRGINVVARAVTGNPDFDLGRQVAVIIGIEALGGLGLGLSPMLLVAGSDPQVLQRSIDALEEGIRALGK